MGQQRTSSEERGLEWETKLEWEDFWADPKPMVSMGRGKG